MLGTADGALIHEPVHPWTTPAGFGFGAQEAR